MGPASVDETVSDGAPSRRLAAAARAKPAEHGGEQPGRPRGLAAAALAHAHSIARSRRPPSRAGAASPESARLARRSRSVGPVRGLP